MELRRMLGTGDLRGMTGSENTVTQAGAGTEQAPRQMEFLQQPSLPTDGVKGAWKVNLPAKIDVGKSS